MSQRNMHSTRNESEARTRASGPFWFANLAASGNRGSLVLDSSFIKNVHGSDVVGPNPTDRGRMASKMSLLTDSRGTPLCAVFHKANKHDGSTLKHTLETFQRKVAGHGNFSSLLADKGYDASHCRDVCKRHQSEPEGPRRPCCSLADFSDFCSMVGNFRCHRYFLGAVRMRSYKQCAYRSGA